LAQQEISQNQFVLRGVLNKVLIFSPVYSVAEELESEIETENGNVAVPVNIALPNPNKVEFDNLYLDMNGIVSLSSHALYPL
jgi:5'-3' exonuclease